MLLFNKKSGIILCLLFSLGLAACGFSPMYAPKSRSDNTGYYVTQTKIGQIDDRIGQLLRNHLVARMNPVNEPDTPLFKLDIRLSESKTDLGIERDTSATFAKLVIRAEYTLSRLDTGEPIFKSKARSTNSFNIVNSPYASQVAEDDARKRALRQLSEDISLRIGTFFNSYSLKTRQPVQKQPF